jgi:hypothetical protein
MCLPSWIRNFADYLNKRVDRRMYDKRMKSNPKTSDEYTNFENLLKRVIQVPHSEIKRREEEYKEQRKKEKRPKTSGVSRASSDKD